jgi:antitoxin (DNA-binding transcriptional repressor) of toxin-antitoxin stability system
MKTMTVGEFKTRFREALAAVRDGQTVVVCYGRSRRKVAAMVPYASLGQPPVRPMGLLKGTASVSFARNFAVTDEDLLS